MTQPYGKFGYIYIRCHPSYDLHDICKIGKASNIPERDSQYATGEFIRGQFESVFEVPFEKMDEIEIGIQNKFQELNIREDGGIEFYKKSIISGIEPYFVHTGIDYKKLSKDEISGLLRTNRIRNVYTQIITPRHDQSLIINKAVAHFQEYNKGLLIIPCGVGKTLISLWITQEVEAKTILIGVPNKLLLKQWEENILKIFGNFPYQIISGSVDIGDIMIFFTRTP